MVYYYQKFDSLVKARRYFFEIHFPEEFSNYEKFDDWHLCPIKTNHLRYWAKNVNQRGSTRVPRAREYVKDPAKHNALVASASEVVQRIKSRHDRKLYPFFLTSRKVAYEMEVPQTTAYKLLRLIEGPWKVVGRKESINNNHNLPVNVGY